MGPEADVRPGAAATSGEPLAAFATPAARPEAATRAARLALLGLIVAGVLALKLVAWPEPVGSHALDGANYYQVARHVSSGAGFLTRLSLYHQGFQSFPHETNIYPLWPLVLGYAARVIDLPLAARVLPALFYALSLVLLYALVDRLARALGAGRTTLEPLAPSFTVGHAAALLFALNPIYFRHTSLPYAEGLLYAATFGALVCVDVTRDSTRRRALGAAALAGALAGAAFLCRPQMITLVVAVPVALALTGAARAGALSAITAAAVVLPWVVHLARLVAPFSAAALVDFAAYRETPSIPPFPLTVPTATALDFLLDRASGLAVAFDPFHPNGYARSFGPAVGLLLVGLAALGLRAPSLREAGRWLRSPRSRTVTATCLTAAGALAAVHEHHATLTWEWWFHWRHGLPLILPLGLALAATAAFAPVPLRRIGLAVVAWSAFAIATPLADTIHFLRLQPGSTPEEVAMIEWIGAQNGEPSFVSTKAQSLAALSPRGGFHWTTCGDDPARTARLLSDAGADYVVLYPGEETCTAFASLLPQLQVVGSFNELRVLAARAP